MTSSRLATLIFYSGLVILVGCSNSVKEEKIKPVLFSGGLSNGQCEFREGVDGQLVLLGRVALAKDKLVDAGIYIQDGIIQEIGEPDKVSKNHTSAYQLKCKNAFFSPGLINAHEHTSFSFDFPKSAMQHDYIHRDEWRKGGGRAIEPESVDTKDGAVKVWVELRHLVSGSTTVAGSSGINGVVRNINSSPTVDFFQVDLATFPFGPQSLIDLDPLCKDSTLPLPTPRFTKDVLLTAPYVPHVGEGRNCVATKEVDAYLAYLDKNPSRKYSLIHGVMINKNHYSSLQKNNVSVIWSPRSNVALYGTSLNPIPLIENHISVAMGTDWSPSGSFNMFEEMRCGKDYTRAKSSRAVADEELWEMSTVNGAVALGVNDKVGSIAVGKTADIIVVNDPDNSGISTISRKQVSDVLAVFINGHLMAGEQKAIAGDWIKSACPSQYGSKFICIDFPKSYQKTFDEIIAANKASVDLLSVDKQASCIIH